MKGKSNDSISFRVGLTVFFILKFIYVQSAFSEDMYVNKLIEIARQKELHKSRYWHLLLHYRPLFFGGYESEVDDPEFFNAKNGRIAPGKELDATIRAFFLPQNSSAKEAGKQENGHAQCNFVARLAWLEKEIPIDRDKLPKIRCARYRKWLKKLNVESVTLVFASYYMNNPASAFGHTLLRLNTGGWRKQTGLINYGVNYGVDFSQEPGPIVYVLGGLLGWFPGSFSIFPYYTKVRVYNNLEWRDMWEYDLRIEKNEINRLMKHLWELGGTYFDYYFPKENCSYHLLSLLEVAKPDLHLRDEFKFFTVPAQTIKLLYQNGLVENKSYRPSLVSRFQQKYSLLNDKEIACFKRLQSNPRIIDSSEFRGLSERSRARIIDVYTDYLSYRKTTVRHKSDLRISREERNLHLIRSRLLNVEPEEKFSPQSTDPGTGHDIGKISLGLGYDKHQFFEELSFRVAYHDLLDPSPGYDPFTRISFLEGAIRFNNSDKEIEFESLELIRVLSLTPYDHVAKKHSWKFHVVYERAKDLPCDSCHYLSLNYGHGLNVRSKKYPLSLFCFLDLESHIGGSLEKSFRAGPGTTVGLLYDFTGDFRSLFQMEYLYLPFGQKSQILRGSLAFRYAVSRNTDVRLIMDKTRHEDQILFTFTLFY